MVRRTELKGKGGKETRDYILGHDDFSVSEPLNNDFDFDDSSLSGEEQDDFDLNYFDEDIEQDKPAICFAESDGGQYECDSSDESSNDSQYDDIHSEYDSDDYCSNSECSDLSDFSDSDDVEEYYSNDESDEAWIHAQFDQPQNRYSRSKQRSSVAAYEPPEKTEDQYDLAMQLRTLQAQTEALRIGGAPTPEQGPMRTAQLDKCVLDQQYDDLVNRMSKLLSYRQDKLKQLALKAQRERRLIDKGMINPSQGTPNQDKYDRALETFDGIIGDKSSGRKPRL